MKNFLIAAGLTAFAIGACNTAARDGMTNNDNTSRDRTTTTTPSTTTPSTADRGTMPSGTTTTPPRSTTRPQGTATPSADGSSTTTNGTDMRDGTTAPGERTDMDRPTDNRDMDRSDMDRSDMNRTDMDRTGMSTNASADMTDPKQVTDAVTQYGGLTKLPKNVAMQVVDGYITKLSGMPGTSALVSDLNVVKSQLGMSSIDGKIMGAALQRLGAKTVSMADGDASYRMLGQALESSGDKLVGM